MPESKRAGGAAGGRQASTVPLAGRKSFAGILGVEPRLDGVPVDAQPGLRDAQRIALRDADLLAHEVQAADGLRHRMLHLQAGVHLQEPEVPAAEQELHGAGGGVPDGGRGLHGGGAHRLAQGVVEGRRGRLLDDLLVATLDRALALEAMHDVAPLVAQDLHFDVARPRQPALEEDRVVAEGARGLAPRRLDRRLEVVRRFHHPHALAAAARGGLDQQRIADRLRGGRRVGAGRDLVRGQRGHAGRVHRALGGQLVAHRGDGVGRRPHPDQPRLLDGAREAGVLREEAVAGVDRLRAAAPGRVEDLSDVEVALGRRATAQRDRLVGLAHERRVGVAVGVDGDRAQAHLAGGAHDAPRDLAAVGDEQAAEAGRRRHHIRQTPYPAAPLISLLWQAESDRPMTVRVSRGSMMPSSETREVA